MSKFAMRPMDVKRFSALVGPSRTPGAAYISKELAWFSNSDESILGSILLDIEDTEFVSILLGRDEVGRYRLFDLKHGMKSPKKAEDWLAKRMEHHTATGKKVFEQGDATGEAMDLFTPIVADKKLHPFFLRLRDEPSFSSAKEIIAEMAPHFVDIDGNYVEQFQSTGFDARLWELYLNAYLVEEALFFDREHYAPDFLVKKFGKTVAIEAVIVGRKTAVTDETINRPIEAMSPEELMEKTRDEMPIKFGSPLFSKLKKEYWKLDHVAGNPLVIAIADFHDNQSMTWSGTALLQYLYGVRHDFHRDDEGNLIISPLKIETHQVGDKVIPSGYFFQPDAENISAILFTAGGTISKFNRMVKQAGFGSASVIMHRAGTYHDHDPNASLPKMFGYEVNETCQETWAEGVSMFHNPNALYPVPRELFPSIAHHRFDDGQIVSDLPEFHTYASQTFMLNITDKK